MKFVVKTLAVAGLAGTLAAPAFAAAHMDVSTMTCEQYNELGGADRDKVAMMVLADMDSNTEGSDGTATANQPADMETEEESNTSASVEGSANSTSIAPADDDLARMSEDIRRLNRVCSRNWDAMVTEAAAGLSGTR
ncbi:hypothetical protein BOO69_17595 [Sulfitobacter alexandrii]|uniref:HdeA/HdeB family protein n=1 Tax=Sulfitobacter alexandrii TaxID=1917485 RepID=A0A1J0WL57_9RHOB|nr:HdeA/HdeB family chaperone [Sulfitobacter alexandrii]APE45021.1 hypothetical protein BOO69_17595 [Sulfitobacter alexandrii]